ncbi:MAG: drug/metabolite transporter (DMT)-like permease [Parasphingorhabdus sp.]
MSSSVLLILVTVFYAGYNIFIKLSGEHVPPIATTTILATICLQVAALATSVIFISALAAKGGHVFTLAPKAYLWATVGGVCIGVAEIGYLYLFGGLGGLKPMAANIAIPTIVCGTIVIAMLFSYIVLKESFNWNHMLGSLLIFTGVVFLFFPKTTIVE